MREELLLSAGAVRRQELMRRTGTFLLMLTAFASVFAVFFIFWFIARDAYPFFKLRGFVEFFTGRHWMPSANPPSFGALPIFLGSLYVTLGPV